MVIVFGLRVSFFNEFVISCPTPIADINEQLLDYDILGGYDLGKCFEDLQNHMLVAVTEMNGKDEIDHLFPRWRRCPMSEPLIYELSSPGRIAVSLPDPDVSRIGLPSGSYSQGSPSYLNFQRSMSYGISSGCLS